MRQKQINNIFQNWFCDRHNPHLIHFIYLKRKWKDKLKLIKAKINLINQTNYKEETDFLIVRTQTHPFKENWNVLFYSFLLLVIFLTFLIKSFFQNGVFILMNLSNLVKDFTDINISSNGYAKLFHPFFFLLY